MTIRRKAASPLTPAQYLDGERNGQQRHEYWQGEVFALAGASRTHNRITVNLVAMLKTRLSGTRCGLYSSDMRVKVRQTGLYTYPDLAVVCGQELFEDTELDTLLNPTVIVEVLSPSTEAYDRGAKFMHYRQLPSLREYLLVAQDRPAVDHFVRQADGNWLLVPCHGHAATVELASLACSLPLAEIYDQVGLPDTGDGSMAPHAMAEMTGDYTIAPTTAHDITEG